MVAPVVVPPLISVPSYVVGADPQTAFAFQFPFWETADIFVYVGGELLDDSAFTVEGLYEQAGQDVIGGFGSGIVNLVAPVSNTTVEIDRQVVVARQSVFAPGAPLPIPALNGDLNKMVGMMQDLQRQVVSLAAQVKNLQLENGGPPTGFIQTEAG